MNTNLINALPEVVTIRGEAETRNIYINDKWLDPKYSLFIRYQSPDGFDWGYGGNGPAQLALAILMHFLPIEDALIYYHDFKWKVIASLPMTDFQTTINLRKEIHEIKHSKILH
jgi:hypothetical protein